MAVLKAQDVHYIRSGIREYFELLGLGLCYGNRFRVIFRLGNDALGSQSEYQNVEKKLFHYSGIIDSASYVFLQQERISSIIRMSF